MTKYLAARLIKERRKNKELLINARRLLESKLKESCYENWVASVNAEIKKINQRIREST